MHAQPNPGPSPRVRTNLSNAVVAALEDDVLTAVAKTATGILPDEHELRRLRADGRDFVRLADELAGSPAVPLLTAPRAWRMLEGIEEIVGFAAEQF